MQNHAAQLTRALDRLGVEQLVLTAYRAGAERSEAVGSRGRVLRCGVPTRHLRQLYGISAAFRSCQIARDVDVVHAHVGEDVAVLPLGHLAARIHARPLVITVHSSLTHTNTAAAGRISALTRALGARIEQWSERCADMVVVLTPRLRRLLLAAGLEPERVLVIPSGVDPALFAGGHRDPFPEVERPRVLYVGRLAREKGVDVLLAAAGLLRTPASMLVVGDGPERAGLERKLDELRLRDRVQIFGFWPHHRVPAALSHADLLVLPSRCEELGSVLVEALEAGLPVVASRTGGIPHVVREGETGLLVPPEDPAALAEAIDRLLVDDAARERMATAGRRHAPFYYWDRLAGEILACYEQAVRRAPGGAPGATSRSARACSRLRSESG